MGVIGSDESENSDEDVTDEQMQICKQIALDWVPVEGLTDDFRHPDAHKDGGFPLNDAAVIGRYRAAAKDIIK